MVRFSYVVVLSCLFRQYYHNTNCIRRGASGSSCNSSERVHMQKGKPVSYWFRVTATAIIFGGGTTVDENEFTRSEFSYMRQSYSLDRNFRIDQFTVASNSSGVTSFSNIKVRSGASAAAAVGADGAVAAPRCTFAKSGANYIQQQWYYCDTCDMDENSNQGVCEACKDVCHKDHAVRAGRNSLFYCDCGSGARAADCKTIAAPKPAEPAVAAVAASSSSSSDSSRRLARAAFSTANWLFLNNNSSSFAMNIFPPPPLPLLLPPLPPLPMFGG